MLKSIFCLFFIILVSCVSSKKRQKSREPEDKSSNTQHVANLDELKSIKYKLSSLREDFADHILFTAYSDNPNKLHYFEAYFCDKDDLQACYPSKNIPLRWQEKKIILRNPLKNTKSSTILVNIRTCVDKKDQRVCAPWREKELLLTAKNENENDLVKKQIQTLYYLNKNFRSFEITDDFYGILDELELSDSDLLRKIMQVHPLSLVKIFQQPQFCVKETTLSKTNKNSRYSSLLYLLSGIDDGVFEFFRREDFLHYSSQFISYFDQIIEDRKWLITRSSYLKENNLLLGEQDLLIYDYFNHQKLSHSSFLGNETKRHLSTVLKDNTHLDKISTWFVKLERAALKDALAHRNYIRFYKQVLRDKSRRDFFTSLSNENRKIYLNFLSGGRTISRKENEFLIYLKLRPLLTRIKKILLVDNELILNNLEEFFFLNEDLKDEITTDGKFSLSKYKKFQSLRYTNYLDDFAKSPLMGFFEKNPAIAAKVYLKSRLKKSKEVLKFYLLNHRSELKDAFKYYLQGKNLSKTFKSSLQAVLAWIADVEESTQDEFLSNPNNFISKFKQIPLDELGVSLIDYWQATSLLLKNKEFNFFLNPLATEKSQYLSKLLSSLTQHLKPRSVESEKKKIREALESFLALSDLHFKVKKTKKFKEFVIKKDMDAKEKARREEIRQEQERIKNAKELVRSEKIFRSLRKIRFRKQKNKQPLSSDKGPLESLLDSLDSACHKSSLMAINQAALFLAMSL